MKKFECDVCGYVYDPERGVPELGIPPGTPFEKLPEDFCCPVCGAETGMFSALAPAALQVSASVLDVIRRTPSVKSFRLAAAGRASFKPGQYLSITLENWPDLTRCLSISSSPTEEGYLEVTKRITQSEFSQTLDRVEPGYEVSITYPMGTFTFEGEVDKIALLSGGIGITPLRSICKYVVDRQLDTSVCLLYANRSPEEIVFKSEFDAMENMGRRLKVVYAVSRFDEAWTGRRGRIDAALIREELPDYQERCFFTCGPPQMVEAMGAILRSELRLPEAQIRTENFDGY
jgi:ferredoxin-NADP reductase/rubredoxin